MTTNSDVPIFTDIPSLVLPMQSPRPNNEPQTNKKGVVIDAAITAEKGDFLDVPEFICRHIE